mmetsp:Transcript_35509/g.34535  ORF Transcript_35509/g.34535 Transcript_35509/m.34535 type:complete len:111 (-) Transcript_35509:84-416(-)
MIDVSYEYEQEKSKEMTYYIGYNIILPYQKSQFKERLFDLQLKTGPGSSLLGNALFDPESISHRIPNIPVEFVLSDSTTPKIQKKFAPANASEERKVDELKADEEGKQEK